MLVHLFHQLVVIPAAFSQHLRTDCVNFGNDWIFVNRFRHTEKTPPA